MLGSTGSFLWCLSHCWCSSWMKSVVIWCVEAPVDFLRGKLITNQSASCLWLCLMFRTTLVSCLLLCFFVVVANECLCLSSALKGWQCVLGRWVIQKCSHIRYHCKSVATGYLILYIHTIFYDICPRVNFYSYTYWLCCTHVIDRRYKSGVEPDLTYTLRETDWGWRCLLSSIPSSFLLPKMNFGWSWSVVNWSWVSCDYFAGENWDSKGTEFHRANEWGSHSCATGYWLKEAWKLSSLPIIHKCCHLTRCAGVGVSWIRGKNTGRIGGGGVALARQQVSIANDHHNAGDHDGEQIHQHWIVAVPHGLQSNQETLTGGTGF